MMSLAVGRRRLALVYAFFGFAVVAVWGASVADAAAPAVSRFLMWSGPVFTDGHGVKDLSGLSCPSSTQCTTMDVAGRALTFDPSRPGSRRADPVDLSAVAGSSGPSGGSEALVSCPSTRQCTIADGLGREVTFDPTGPGVPVPVAITRPSKGPAFTGLACPTTRQCTALAGSGQRLTFDPFHPSAVTRAPLAGAALACPTATECVAVGQDGTALTFNPQGTGAPSSLATGVTPSYGGPAIACPTASQCTEAGAEGAVATFDPLTSTILWSGNLDPGENFNAVSCAQASQCVALAGSGTEVTFDPAGGTADAPVRLLLWKGPLLFTLVCPPASTRCQAVVNPFSNAISFLANDPTHHVLTTVSPGWWLTGVACPTTRRCLAVASVNRGGGLEEAYGLGGQTASVDVNTHRGKVNDFRLPLTAVTCPTARLCVAVGGFLPSLQPGLIATFRQPFTAPPALRPVAATLTTVACPSSRECVAGGDSGEIVRFDPTADRPVSIRSLSRSAIVALSCVSARWCVAVDGSGQAVKFDPLTKTGVRRTRLRRIGAVSGIACPRYTECLAVWTSGYATRFDPASTARPYSRRLSSAALTGIACRPGGECVAIDALGESFQGSGLRDPWTEMLISGATALTAISCSSHQCAVVDSTGHFFIGRPGVIFLDGAVLGRRESPSMWAWSAARR